MAAAAAFRACAPIQRGPVKFYPSDHNPLMPAKPLLVNYQPQSFEIRESDALPAADPNSMNADDWGFIWRGPGQRLEQVRAFAATGEAAARGLIVTGPAAKGESLRQDGGRPDFHFLRHVGPAYMSLSAWGRQVAKGDQVLWIPTLEEFQALLNGDEVALPSNLQKLDVANIRLAVPSQEYPGPEGYLALRGSGAERLETALSLGEVSKTDIHPAGLRKVPHAQWQSFQDEFIEEAFHPHNTFCPMATLRPGQAGRVSFGMELAARKGVLSTDAWKKLMGTLIQREQDFSAAKAVFPEWKGNYYGGSIKLGDRYLGTRSQISNAGQLAEDVRSSIAWIDQLLPQAGVPKEEPIVDFHGGTNDFLSNFFPQPVSYQGRQFPTAEHAYQFAKIEKPTDQETAYFQRCTAAEAKKAGKNLKLRPDWDRVKLPAMEAILRSKFAAPAMAERLAATAGRDLIEGNTWRDNYWGVSPPPVTAADREAVIADPNRNHLGKLLMHLRNEIVDRRPEVINLKKTPDALSRPGVVYAGRPGPKTPGAIFGNPFTKIPGLAGTIQVKDDSMAVDRFRTWLAGESDRDFQQEHRATIRANLDKIRAASGVACFCAPGPCHVPVLIDAAFSMNPAKGRPVASRVDSTRPGQAAPKKGDSSRLAINPDRPLEEWDPRGFAWFLRQVQNVFPGSSPVAGVVRRSIKAADEGNCYPAATFFHALNRELKGDGRAIFREYLKGEVGRAVISTLHNRELAGSRAPLVAVAPRLGIPVEAINREPEPWSLQYHVISDLEQNVKSAERQETFEGRGTEDTSTTDKAARVSITVQFPSRTEAVQSGLVATYPSKAMYTINQIERSKEVDTTAEQLFASLAEMNIPKWREMLDGKGHLGAKPLGFPIQDKAFLAFLDSLGHLATYDNSTVDRLPPFEKGFDLFARYLRSQLSLTSGGFMRNAPASELVQAALRGEILPVETASALKKYTQHEYQEPADAEHGQKHGLRLLRGERYLKQIHFQLQRLLEESAPFNRTYQLETGNPFALTRQAYVYPTEAEARADVKGWISFHAELHRFVPLDEGKAIRGKTAWLAGGRKGPEIGLANDAPLAQKAAGLSSAYAALVLLDQKIQEHESVLGRPSTGLTSFEQLYATFEQFEHNLGLTEAGTELGAGDVYVIAQMVAQSSARELKEDLGRLQQVDNEFGKFLRRVAEWNSPNDVLNEVLAGSGQSVTFDTEATKLLASAFEHRDLREQRLETLVNIGRHLRETEYMVDEIRREYPLVPLLNGRMHNLSPELFAHANILLFREDGGPGTSGGRQLLKAISKELVALANTDVGHFLEDCSRSVTLEGWANEAVKNLTSQSPLVVPLVHGEEDGRKMVAGFGGAYVQFISRFVNAMTQGDRNEFPVPEFDRSGKLQAMAESAWSRTAALEINAYGLASDDDRYQLIGKDGQRGMAQVNRFPDGLSPVPYMIEPREFTAWRSNVGAHDSPSTAQPMATNGPKRDHAHDLAIEP